MSFESKAISRKLSSYNLQTETAKRWSLHDLPERLL